VIRITTLCDIAENLLFIYKTLPFLDAIFTRARRLMGYYSQVEAVMSSLVEVVLWGAPLILLGWGLLLGLGCAMVFREHPAPPEKPRPSGIGAEA
jgi:hypothetical protein